MDMDARVLRMAVASKALGILPSRVSMDTATALASRGQPRVVRERVCAIELVIAALVMGIALGYVMHVVMARRVSD